MWPVAVENCNVQQFAIILPKSLYNMLLHYINHSFVNPPPLLLSFILLSSLICLTLEALSPSSACLQRTLASYKASVLCLTSHICFPVYIQEHDHTQHNPTTALSSGLRDSYLYGEDMLTEADDHTMKERMTMGSWWKVSFTGIIRQT